MSLLGIFPYENWSFHTSAILDSLTQEQYDFLIGRRSKQSYKKGESIFREGTRPSGIYYIHQGKVKKFKRSHPDREQIVYVANTGELFGYHAVLGEEDYPDSASAMQNSLISFIPTEDFFSLLNSVPGFSAKLLKAMSHEFTVFTNNLLLLSHGSAESKLATALIIFREKSKDEFSEGQQITIEISRSDLASMAGIAPENVTRILTKFRNEQLVKTEKRKMWVTNVKKLVAQYCPKFES